jgi:heavy metal efflux system protein
VIAWLVSWSLRNRLSVFGLVVALVVFGVHGYVNLTVDAVPDVTGVQVQVLTSAPGLSPLEVESLVTRPVELSLTGIPGVTVTRSVSRSAISAVTLVFAETVDLNRARSLVAERLPAAREAVGGNAERPLLGPLSTGQGTALSRFVTYLTGR